MSSVINSKNPANSTLAGAFAETWEKFISDVDDCLPAEVVSYDREENIATVQPLIQRVRTDGTTISRPLLEEIPCVALGSGRALITFTLQEGDRGWIKSTDRDISLYLESLTERPPNSLRKHSFSDAIFIPDVWNSYLIDGDDNDALVLLQTSDATQRIVLTSDDIRMASDSLVTINSPTTNTTGNTNLGNTGSSPGIARLGDQVEVIIPVGVLDPPNNTLPTVPVTVSGTITSASSNNTAN